MQEPGLDTHEWISQWEALQPELEDSPAEALPEVAYLIEGIVGSREPDPEVERELAIGRLVAGRLEAGETVDPGDLGAAVAAYRAVYGQLVTELQA